MNSAGFVIFAADARPRQWMARDRCVGGEGSGGRHEGGEKPRPGVLLRQQTPTNVHVDKVNKGAAMRWDGLVGLEGLCVVLT